MNPIPSVNGANFHVIEVPGHTTGHIVFFSDETQSPTLLSGDTIFAANCGRLFEGSPQQMFQSLNKLASLPTNTLIYCTHKHSDEQCVSSAGTFAIVDSWKETSKIREQVPLTTARALPKIPPRNTFHSNTLALNTENSLCCTHLRTEHYF